MKKIIKYILLAIVIVLVGYKSVYFKNLTAIKNQGNEIFDAATYTKKLWDEKLPARLDTAIGLTQLIQSIKANPDEAFARYSNAMAIGNYRYSLVKVTGTAVLINQDEVLLQVNGADSSTRLHLATEYIYGNAIRDASGLVQITDFDNTTHLNNISEEMNRSVRVNLLPAFKKQVRLGNKIEVTGAVEFNKAHIDFKDLELLPLRIKILD